MYLRNLLIPSLVLGLTIITHAASINVSNADFSINATSTATDWADIEVGGANVYYITSEASSPDGVAYLMSSGSSLSPNFNGIVQNLSVTNAGLTAASYTSYTISFMAGFRDDVGQTGAINMSVALVDLGSDGIYQSSDTILASWLFSRSADATPADMTAEVAHLNVNSSSTNQIGLVFLNENIGTTWQQTGMIDNISITAVPEPSIALLGGMGLLGLIRRRRA